MLQENQNLSKPVKTHYMLEDIRFYAFGLVNLQTA